MLRRSAVPTERHLATLAAIGSRGAVLLLCACASQGVGVAAPLDTVAGDGRAFTDGAAGDADDLCGCDDGNPCTRDLCSSGHCSHEAMPVGVVACTDAEHARVCAAGGTLVVESCGARCEELGYNGVTGCSNDSCGCTNLGGGGACAVGAEACVSPDGVTQYRAVCLANDVLGTSAPVWQVRECDVVCAEGGFGVAVGCTYNPSDYAKRVCVCGDVCTPPCTGDTYCDWQSGSCVGGSSSECDFTSDCPSHMICSSHRCLYVDCTNDSNCAYCHRCDGYSCVACGQNAYGGCGC